MMEANSGRLRRSNVEGNAIVTDPIVGLKVIVRNRSILLKNSGVAAIVMR